MSIYHPPSPSPQRRQPSTASVSSLSSSAYSFPSSRSTTVTSTSSLSSRFGDPPGSPRHKQSSSAGCSNLSPRLSAYTTSSPVHDSSRPLPSIPSRDGSPMGARHVRGASVPAVSPSGSPRSAPTPSPYNSMNRNSLISGTSALKKEELDHLRTSSVSHFRTLSKITREGSVDEFGVTNSEDVMGMHGRKRLQRAQTDTMTSWERLHWMDKRRQYIQAYEYLCHIGEAKEWMEECIGEPIPPIVELEEALRDGVALAKLTRAFAPELVPRIFEHPKLQFRHSDNIDRFFRFLRKVQLPDVFFFETTDLYNKKNIPKVIYCIHALSFLLYRLGLTTHSIGNLVGKLEFTEAELKSTQKGLDVAGVSMPSFRGVGGHFDMPEPEPEPQETEEERIARELGESREEVAEFQSLCRGALLRMQLAYLMEDLWDAEDGIIDLQSRVRGMFSRISFAYRAERSRWATGLQAAVRGHLLRSNLFAHQRQLERNNATFVKIQARIRGSKARQQVQSQRRQLECTQKGVVAVQAAIRGCLKRAQLADQMDDVYESEEGIGGFQALVRGALARWRCADTLAQLYDEEAAVIDLQSTIRGKMIRRSMESKLTALQAEDEVLPLLQAVARGWLLRRSFSQKKQQSADFAPMWALLQAAVRGSLVRWEFRWKIASLAEVEDEIVELQAQCRGCLARDYYHDTLQDLEDAVVEITSLQAKCRGVLVRWQVKSTQQALEAQVGGVIDLQSRARGFLYRLERQRFLDALQAEVESIVEIQAAVRGVLVRDTMDGIVMAVQAEEEAVVELQAAARATIERKRFHGKLKHFKDNMEKVVKIQSFVRAKQQGEAYKSLMGGKNPPVGTVKNFVHLLNDSDFDFDEEIEFEGMRKKVVQHVRANELAETYVDQLDVKIALLVKNKITLDEVIKHQKRFTGHVGNLLSNTDIASADPFDLKALNNNSRKRLERYQQMFYALQTQPEYLSRLFKRIRENNTAEVELKRIENLMMGLFGYSQKRREEFYLLKLVARSVQEEINTCQRPEDFLRGNFFWIKLVNSYIRSPRDRKFLRDLLGPLIKEEIIDNDELDLESDPLQIYRASINNEELRTGKRSRRDPDVGREIAIKDPETRETFIAHLQALRNLCDDFMTLLEDNVHRMPYGIRYIAGKAVEALMERFPNDEEAVMLQVVEHFVYQRYFNPAILGPDTLGIAAKNLTPLQKKNLGELGKILNQITSGRLFALENVFLQPLNEYVSVAIRRFKDIFGSIINVPPIETRFEMDDYDDLTSKQRPILYIKMSDIFAIHRLVATGIDTIAGSREDPLRDVINELGSVKTSESELRNVGNTEISLQLDPSLHRIEDPDSEVKALMVETKRCILYIIRVQTGTSLMEILVKPILPEDEERWVNLLRDEKQESGGKRKGAYADHNSPLVDIESMSYAQLKRTALECVIRLERLGKITRTNQYQGILNAIATDIRTKHRRRVQRSREMEGVQQTLAHLQEKAAYLEAQLQSYNDYIEQAMVTLQTKKGKKKTILPFTRQYFHMRELQRTGRVPKFGSYKYTARGLADKGVLVRLDNYPEKRWDKINFTISSDEVGVFFVEASNGSMMIPGASAQVLLDDLLQMQFHNNQFMVLCDGMIKFNVNLFLHLLFRKFYRDE